VNAKTKILILGNNGFIGKAIFENLSSISDLQVEGFNSSTLDLSGKDSFHQLGEKVDKSTIVVFLARARKNSDPLISYDKDTVIASNVARFLAKYPIKKFLFFSSISVYGEFVTDLNITEETKIAPSSHYGISKFATENLLRLAAQEMNTPLIVLRPCMIFGPGNLELPYGPDRFINSLTEKNHIDLYGDGSESRDFLFINDLVKITKKYIFEDCSGIYNLGTGISSTFSYIVDNLRSLVGKDFPIIKNKRVKPQIDQVLNISRLMDFYPDCVFTPLKIGLKQTLDSYQSIFANKT